MRDLTRIKKSDTSHKNTKTYVRDGVKDVFSPTSNLVSEQGRSVQACVLHSIMKSEEGPHAIGG